MRCWHTPSCASAEEAAHQAREDAKKAGAAHCGTRAVTTTVLSGAPVRCPAGAGAWRPVPLERPAHAPVDEYESGEIPVPGTAVEVPGGVGHRRGGAPGVAAEHDPAPTAAGRGPDDSAQCRGRERAAVHVW